MTTPMRDLLTRIIELNSTEDRQTEDELCASIDNCFSENEVESILAVDSLWSQLNISWQRYLCGMFLGDSKLPEGFGFGAELAGRLAVELGFTLENGWPETVLESAEHDEAKDSMGDTLGLACYATDDQTQILGPMLRHSSYPTRLGAYLCIFSILWHPRCDADTALFRKNVAGWKSNDVPINNFLDKIKR